MSEDIHKWSNGRYTLMFDEHTFFVWDNEKDERMTALNVTKKLNEQQATITSLKDENLYNNFKLKSVDDLKKLKDIFEICMILIDGAITDEDLELGYESVFQFERRIKKFNGDLNE